MATGSTDTQRLLSPTSADDVILPPEPPPTSARSPGGSAAKFCRRFFFVEPVLIIYFFSEFPVDMIGQKYILDWITTENIRRDALRNITHDLNHSHTPCEANITDSEYYFQEDIQSQASRFNIIESIVWGLPATIMTICLGAQSDLLGRRFAIIPPLVGVVTSSSIMLTVVWLNASIWWLVLGDVIYGCCGSFTAMTMGCFAFIADKTPVERRMIRITIVEMCMLAAGIVSPLGMGPVITKIGNRGVLLIIMSVSIVNLTYVSIFLENKPSNDDLERRHEENLSSNCDEDRLPEVDISSKSTCSPWSSVKHTASMFYKSDVGTVRRRLKLNILLLSFFISNLPTFSFSLSTLFEMNYPLCWSVQMIGIFTGFSLAVYAIGAMIAAPVLKCCVSDLTIAIIAGIAAVLTNIYKGFVEDTFMMFLSPTVSMFSALLIPSIRSIMSGLADETEQGAVFGVIACAEVICVMVGTVIFQSIYSSTLTIMTGFVFFIMACFYAVGCIFLVGYRILVRVETSRQQVLSEATINS